MTRSLSERIARADELSNRYLAEANAAGESGKTALEGRLIAKSQFWLDRYNKLTGNAS